MNLFTSLKTVCWIAFGAILIYSASQNPVWGQRTGTTSGGTGGGTSSPITDQGIAGSDVQMSELSSQASNMPRFSGFERLDRTIPFLGNSGTYYPPRSSAGTRLSSGTQASSGNTRTTTTGSRTTRTASTARNRTTTGMMGNMGRTGGLGGTNTNTVRSVTSLGYSFNETTATLRPEQTVRVSQIENRIKNNHRINAIAPITVEIENTTAVLRGIVENEHQRKLLEQFVKLEPGIYRVQNELTLPPE